MPMHLGQSWLDALAAARSPAGLRDGLARYAGVLDGIEAYLAHPFGAGRTGPAPAVRMRRGAACLLDYGGSGPAVLLVPSLVNRAHVLDLAPGFSLARWLAASGVRVLLLDWGEPGPAERRFGLADYLRLRLEPALERSARLAGGPLVPVGYCMGGPLALALALRRPELVRGLGLLASPWDFHQPAPLLPPGAIPPAPLARRLGRRGGVVPVDLLQLLFGGLDPGLAGRKFDRFRRLDPGGAEARSFVAVEDWANDGVPLALRVALECLTDWYGANAPARGAWRVGRTAVTPERLAVPAFVAVPTRDRLVAPASALALAERLPAATVGRRRR